MESSDDRGQIEWEKEHEPLTWLKYTFERIDKDILEYNEVANKLNLKVIIPFWMTQDEAKEVASNGESNL